MTSVSVLTAAYKPNRAYLIDAYESLKIQDVHWEWIIQIDGQNGVIADIPEAIRNDDRVHVFTNNMHARTAATRNLGLLKCRFDYVQNLDADDILQPGALSELAKALDQTGAAFAFGRTFNVRPDGSLWQWSPAPYDFGIIEPGIIGDRWLETGLHHVTLAATMWRKTHLHAYGGWGAMSGREDLYLLLGVCEDHPAVYVDAKTLHYREHEKQTTRRPEFLGKYDMDVQALCAYRLLATRKLRGQTIPPESWAFVDELSSVKIDLPPLGIE